MTLLGPKGVMVWFGVGRDDNLIDNSSCPIAQNFIEFPIIELKKYTGPNKKYLNSCNEISWPGSAV